MTEIYVAPQNLSTLCLKDDGSDYVSENSERFIISEGIPIFLDKESLSNAEKWSIDEYENTKLYYDNAIDWLFASFKEDEATVRNRMIDGLECTPNSKILEVGCGTGRDTEYLAKRLSADGQIYFQDIAFGMVKIARDRIKKLDLKCKHECFVSSATKLPFKDGEFDGLYSFGGLNEFPDLKKTIKELCRVVKPGGYLILGDENIAPWLTGTEYANIIVKNNPIFERSKVPLEYLPQTARNVSVTWEIGNCFYVIKFKEGNPPSLNLDLPHKGWRGGTLRSRYFGQLDGVSPDTKEMVIRAAKQSGTSLHQWLDETLSSAAKNEVYKNIKE